MLVTVSSMWFTGRFSGAATVLVTDPSQVTGLPEEAGAFGAEVRVAGLAVVVVVVWAGFASVDVDMEEDEEEDESVPEPEPEAGVPAGDFAGVVVAAEAPSSWTPVPSLHAVRESAARTAVAAAATRRVRGVRRLDIWLCPFGVRVGW
ncbi:hypothetical protein GCM10018793_05530 [Streptomyces sulfonofaciens]|uniref:Uncharacterized protein n=1 Tax=Streptomyces sulfonofaciens TaxID=68272 RepID=A0A919FRX1_9ACTN|nr:hypothetical protein GCM10018793_05530 [Streptomyces sulfonofaciens]